MFSFEAMTLPPVTDKRSLHVVDLLIETKNFYDMYEDNPEAALGFWSRIQEEFGEQGVGYSPQEFTGLSWEADILLAQCLKENAHA